MLKYMSYFLTLNDGLTGTMMTLRIMMALMLSPFELFNYTDNINKKHDLKSSPNTGNFVFTA